MIIYRTDKKKRKTRISLHPEKIPFHFLLHIICFFRLSNRKWKYCPETFSPFLGKWELFSLLFLWVCEIKATERNALTMQKLAQKSFFVYLWGCYFSLCQSCVAQKTWWIVRTLCNLEKRMKTAVLGVLYPQKIREVKIVFLIKQDCFHLLWNSSWEKIPCARVQFWFPPTWCLKTGLKVRKDLYFLKDFFNTL